jgi:hypothetical protein
LEEWREQILPLHVENWENLDDKKKTEIISINDFYCGMHFILGLQDNFCNMHFQYRHCCCCCNNNYVIAIGFN